MQINKIQIKRGPSAPQANNLDVGELGYDTTSKKLYVGNIDENGNAADPTLINKVESVNSKTGTVVLKASDVEAVPTTRTINSKALSGDIELTYTDVKAAPEGYGLGIIKDITVDALNGDLRNGWYRIANQSLTVGGYTGTDWYIHVAKYNSNYLVQEMYPLIKGYRYKLLRWCSGGTWAEEWVNPPMVVDTEYRTIERIDNKAVYKKKNTSGEILYRLDGETTWQTQHTLMGAAPSGYGLGSVAGKQTTDLNTCTRNGWYWFTAGAANVPSGFNYGSVFVQARSTTYITQVIFGILYTGNPQIIRYTQDGGTTWVEEWVNPTMAANAEYRTRERLLGKAVFKKADANGNVFYRLDGETTWYPERTQIVKLWQNASPTSTFAEPTISLDLSKYQMVAIEYRYNTTDDFKKMYFGNVGTAMALDVVSTSGYLGWRSATVSTTGISFSAATFNGSSNKNTYVIPVAIYGIKGVI